MGSAKAVALLTGASSGIGEATARDLVGAGWRVVATARRLDRLQALAAELGPACHALALDVTDAAATGGLIEALPAELREIELLINNAGIDIGGRSRFDAGDIEDWAQTIQTNITGLMRVTRAVIPGMLERGRGQIVNIGSSSGVTTFADDAAYIASKHAVHGLTGALRADYQGSGIRIIEILPGLVVTGFAETRWHGDRDKAQAFYDSYTETLTATDISRCVLFAISQPKNVTIAEMLVLPSF